MLNSFGNYFLKGFILLWLLNAQCFIAGGQGAGFNGPLRKSNNANYFTDEGGKAILLTGSHTWANFQEIGEKGQPVFNWEGYLEMMQNNHHNFMRLWVWEQCWGAAWTNDEIFVNPLPYARSGEVMARDGKPQFDLTHWNQSYFDRLRSRIKEAGNHGIYVSVMLFQGFSLNKSITVKSDPYLGHPFNESNNINHISFPNSKSDEDSKATLHSLNISGIVALQEAYAEKIIETVNDLDNVLYEIINEGGGMEWQKHMVEYIKKKEKSMAKQHPVGITHSGIPFVFNEELFQSNADWISPANEPTDWQFGGTVRLEDYCENPPVNPSDKVIILDTDHLWGIGGNYGWAWKSFCRGLNPIFMDPWQPLAGRENRDNGIESYATGGIRVGSTDYPDWDLLRKNMGIIHELAARLDLMNMKPMERLSSTQYCLANPGKEYVVFFPSGGNATLNLSAARVNYQVSWYIPVPDQWIKCTEPLIGGSFVRLSAPFTGAAILYLKRIP
jgi:hypothetical protein